MNIAHIAQFMSLNRLFFILLTILLFGCEDNMTSDSQFNKVSSYQDDDIVTIWGIDFSINNTTIIDLRKNQLP